MKTIIIVGGGPSGMMAAIKAKEKNIDYNVYIIEKNNRVGKKLLLTGNGRCNLSNIKIGTSQIEAYNHEYINQLFSRKENKELVLEELKKIGVETINDNGYIYPYSYTSSSVLDALRNRYIQLGVIEILNTNIVEIEYNQKFELSDSNKKKYSCDYLILATGGLKENQARFFNLKYVEPRWGLTSLKSDSQQLLPIKGLRVKGLVKLAIDNLVVHQEIGEVLFKEDSLSGIVIFNLSSVLNRNNFINRKVEVILDLDPQRTIDFKTRFKNIADNLISDFFLGVLPKMIGLLVLKKSNVDLKSKIYQLTGQEKEAIIKNFYNLRFNIDSNYLAKTGQVSIGGVDLKEIDEFKSRKIKGLSIIGESLDVDGLCGGFNLHFAFYSGIIAGSNIVGED